MPDIFTSPSKPLSPEKTNIRQPNKVARLFSTYLFMPDKVRFTTQEATENIIFLLRKHWITNILWIIVSIILVIIPFFLFPIFLNNAIIPFNIPIFFGIILILGWYLMTLSYILVNFILWYYTISIVTTERIVDIDLVNILNKKFAATRITKIEDVTMKRGGFINALFDFGDVIVQTAAHEAQFQFLDIPHPESVVKTINELMGSEEEAHE